MTTKKISKKIQVTATEQELIEKYDLAPISNEGNYIRIAPDQVDIGLLNYRKKFEEKDLQEFAVELAMHGVLSPITVRETSSGRYELVLGERRLRASVIARLDTVPAMVKDLTDEQVLELMLAENLQRENPHPMHEAQGIQRMQKAGRPIEEIAARLGKSKSFIYSRLKWSELIPDLQEVFLADLLTVQDVTELCFLNSGSQQEFFDKHCKDWQKPNFSLNNIKNLIAHFRYDLKNAPFSTTEKSLVPEVGACGECPFNSATLKSLFPEMAKEAVCTNKSCYSNKCAAHVRKAVTQLIAKHKPNALLKYGEPTELCRAVLDDIPEAAALPEHNYYDYNVRLSYPPNQPQKKEYMDGGEDGKTFDEESYAVAVQEYEAELTDFQHNIDTGSIFRAVSVNGFEVDLAYFHTGKLPNGKKGITSKEVQLAIKAGTATREMITGEIERIEARETRAKEIDRDKVQEQVHTGLKTALQDKETTYNLTAADLTAARLLVYQSLDWSARAAVREMLFTDNSEKDHEGFYAALAKLTDGQYAYMIRMALACKPDGKMPTMITGFTLYKTAEAAGIEVTAIEAAQAEVEKEREQKLKPRIAELKKRLKKFKKAV